MANLGITEAQKGRASFLAMGILTSQWLPDGWTLKQRLKRCRSQSFRWDWGWIMGDKFAYWVRFYMQITILTSYSYHVFSQIIIIFTFSRLSNWVFTISPGVPNHEITPFFHPIHEFTRWIMSDHAITLSPWGAPDMVMYSIWNKTILQGKLYLIETIATFDDISSKLLLLNESNPLL